MWKNVGEVWESVLGCKGSSLKRGVGEMRRGGGCEKMWVRCEKVCWGVGGRCGKVEEWENMEVMWESVLDVGESEKRCGKVCWGVGK